MYTCWQHGIIFLHFIFFFCFFFVCCCCCPQYDAHSSCIHAPSLLLRWQNVHMVLGGMCIDNGRARMLPAKLYIKRKIECGVCERSRTGALNHKQMFVALT